MLLKFFTEQWYFSLEIVWDWKVLNHTKKHPVQVTACRFHPLASFTFLLLKVSGDR